MRRRLATAALALATLGLAMGAAEVVARAVDLRAEPAGAGANPPWLGDRWLLRRDWREELAAQGWLGRYYELFEWDRHLFFRLRAGVDLELLDPLAPAAQRAATRWHARTNAQGFRTPPFAPRAAPGVVRVVALGDSSTFGWGVAEEDAFPARLRGELASRWGLPVERIEVVNLGVPGYSTFQGLVLLERTALPLAPDVVLWSYLANDGALTGEADEIAYARRSGPAGALLAGLHRSHAFAALESWIGAARARWAPRGSPDPRDPAQRNVASYRASRRHVEASIDRAREAGVPIVLVAQCVRDAPAGVLREAARASGAPFVDATALLDAAIEGLATHPLHAAERSALAERFGADALAAHPQWLAFLPDACHPNAIGHRLTAEAVAEATVRALPAPAGASSGAP